MLEITSNDFLCKRGEGGGPLRAGSHTAYPLTAIYLLGWGVIRMYDFPLGASTVLKPLGNFSVAASLLREGRTMQSPAQKSYVRSEFAQRQGKWRLRLHTNRASDLILHKSHGSNVSLRARHQVLILHSNTQFSIPENYVQNHFVHNIWRMNLTQEI